MTFSKAGRSTIAGMLAFVLLMAAPIQTLAEESADTEYSETLTPDYDYQEQNSFTILKQGSSGSAVKKIQERLSELGYFTESATGNFGSVTKKAVIAFQIKCGLDADGIVGQTTYNHLFDDDAPIADATNEKEEEEQDESTSTVISSAPDFTGVLKSGSVGSAVKQMQRRLISLGYLSGSADGAFGAKTTAAVKAFQISCGISVDGTFNFETYVRLYSDDAPKAGTVTATATPAPTEVATNEPTAAPTQAATAAPTAAPTQDTFVTIKKGSSGSTVKAIQKKLISLGYLNDTADGAFGNKTLNAVKAFQNARGLTATGEVDRTTYDALMSGSTATATTAPTATPTAAAYTEVSRGSTGDEVKKLQKRLTELGFYRGSTQGTFGALTESALMDFQSAAGLTRSGKLDASTYAIIYSTSAPYKESEDGDYNELKSGDTGDDVKTLQKRLIELGFLSGSADGAYGAKTAAAIKAFQTACSLTADGVASIETQEYLYASDAPTANGSATAAPTATATPAPTASVTYATLQNGSVGANVKKLQNKLISLKLLSGSADGAYGSKTAAAVKAYQTSVGLTATGIADSTTQAALYGDITINPDTNPTATPTATASTGYTLLKNGSTGDEVKKLEERLKELGYFTGTADTTYDSETVSAVKSFQTANSLDVDGAAGVQTQTRLYSEEAITHDEATERGDVESNTPTAVSGTAPKPVIGDIIEMNWFENTSGFFNRSSGTFKDGSTAIVTDVKTGISFTVRRLGGTNHADVEPATKFDAWQMYRIYGQSWSWTRHAIVVTVGGKNIAASMNGKPHGGESISNNNFVGHFCIHFTNSRTHGTNRVDADHQNAVKTALNTDVSALNAKIQAQ